MPCETANDRARDSEMARMLDLLRRSQENQHALMREHLEALRRARRQLAVMVIVAVAALASVPIWATGGPTTPGTGMAVSGSAAPDRDALMSMLSDDERAQLEDFEQRLLWLSQYMRSNPEFDAGAAVALFLFEMANDMSSVPRMHQEMQVMNSRMAAVPAIVAEMQAINAKLAVMTGAMDSTMGRAGRMFPWMPFAP
jgi:hypothetical protein